jgi:hypothetical protein
LVGDALSALFDDLLDGGVSVGFWGGDLFFDGKGECLQQFGCTVVLAAR